MTPVGTDGEPLRRATIVRRLWRRVCSALGKMGQDSAASRLVVAGYAITMKGVVGFDPRDAYHLVVALSWPRFLLMAVGAELLMNAAFAVFYLAQPGAIANVRPGSFADAFFFSVETSATVGYGEMHPVTFYGHIVCTAEIFYGIAMTALTTGLLFVRFSHPRPRIGYAGNAVIARPLFALAWTMMHRIDETSPLDGYDPPLLKEHDARLWLSSCRSTPRVTRLPTYLSSAGWSPTLAPNLPCPAGMMGTGTRPDRRSQAP